jgi:hypothetical protein
VAIYASRAKIYGSNDFDDWKIKHDLAKCQLAFNPEIDAGDPNCSEALAPLRSLAQRSNRSLHLSSLHRALNDGEGRARFAKTDCRTGACARAGRLDGDHHEELQRACRVLREAEQFGPVVNIVFQRVVQLTMPDGEFTP